MHTSHFYFGTCPKEKQVSSNRSVINVNDTPRAELTGCYLGVVLRGGKYISMWNSQFRKSLIIWITLTNYRHFYSRGHVFWRFFNMNLILQP